MGCSIYSTILQSKDNAQFFEISVFTPFYPRPADSIGHLGVRPSSVPPSSLPPKCRKKSNSNFSALELDRDLGFSRGHQGHRPHDDDDDEEDDDEVEDNNRERERAR